MSLIDTDFPEDAEVVMAEVITHLIDVDHRRLTDARGIDAAWREVRQCDMVVLDVLAPRDRADYAAVLAADPDAAGPAVADGLPLRAGTRGLHTAIHRRVSLLQDISTHGFWLDGDVVEDPGELPVGWFGDDVA